jgi:hypothetical protein
MSHGSFQSKQRERLVCHAAVLGLLGWYLMMPRLYFTHGHIVQAVRLSDWEVLGRYNSASECEETLHTLYPAPRTPAFLARLPSQLSLKEYNAADARARKDALCISTDDPRLAK